MARDSITSKEIYKKHIRLFRHLNDSWIFMELIRPGFERAAKKLRATKDLDKKTYKVPKEDGKSKDDQIEMINSFRRDEEVGGLYYYQYNYGLFETNIISAISRTEAFIQDCLVIVINSFPRKLSILADKSGIPLDLFLGHDRREDIINRYVALKCEGLMFAKPSEYIEKLKKVLDIEIDDDLILDYIEIKASRDIIIHNNGKINELYVNKAGKKARGAVGNNLKVDYEYFRHVIAKLKRLSGIIQRETEKVYK